jgi:hypothetical protein
MTSFYIVLICTDVFLGLRMNHRDLLRVRGNIHIHYIYIWSTYGALTFVENS